MRNAIIAAIMLLPNATPLPHKAAQKIGCVAYQVCQTCYDSNGNSHPCGCHMECLPGIH